jgi:hypothetical protein
MYQMTTGVMPFEGASAEQVMECILNAPAPPLGGLFSLVLKKVFARMLEKVFFCLWGGVFFLLSGTGK